MDHSRALACRWDHLDKTVNATRIPNGVLSDEALVRDMLQAPDSHIESHLHRRHCEVTVMIIKDLVRLSEGIVYNHIHLYTLLH
jgi:hypothetical protein